MKALIVLCLLASFTSYAAVSLDEVECYSDMSDEICTSTQTQTHFKTHCTIDVTLTLKNGERVPTVLEGKSSIKKNSYALMMNNTVKDRATQEAFNDLYEQLNPFFSMKSCQ